MIPALGRWRQEDQKGIKGHPQLHTVFKSSLGYMISCLKTQNNTKKEEILLAVAHQAGPIVGPGFCFSAEHIQKQLSRKQAMREKRHLALRDPRWFTVRPVGIGTYHRASVLISHLQLSGEHP